MRARAWLAEAYGLRDLRAYGRTPWLLTLGTLLTGTGRGIVAPFIILFLHEARGLDLGLLGLGILVEFLLRACMGPLAGALSDRVGRKPLMLTGLAATSVILPSYLLVHTSAQFLLLSVANGLFAAHSLYGPASNAMVVDVVPEGRRGGAFGLLHAARNLGWVVGLGGAAVLVGLGYAWVFVASALLPFAMMLVTAVWIHEPARAMRERRPVLQDWAAIARRPAFLAYLAATLGIYLAQGSVNTIFPLFLHESLGLPVNAVGILAINAGLIVVLQIPFGRLADRSDRAKLLAAACLVLALTDALYAWAAGGGAGAVAIVVAALVVFTFAEMLWSPVLPALAAELAPAGMTGSALGLTAFSTALGQSGPAFLADVLVPVGGWRLVWLALGAACLPCALGMWALGRALSKARAGNAEGAPRAA